MKPTIISRDMIDPDPDQPRRSIDPEPLEQLADSIRMHGLLQPVIVYESGERRILVDGHRRFEAAGLAGLKEVLALVLNEKPNAETLLLIQLEANCQRADLKPTEQALAYKRLLEMRKWTLTEMAAALHVSKSTVTQFLSFLNLPENGREMLDAGTLARSTAYAISRETDPARRAALLEKAMQGELRRDDAAKQVSQKPSRPSRVRCTFRIDDAEVTIATEEELEPELCLSLLQALGRELRKAEREGLNVRTLESVLADRATSSR
jgi:ParB family chromosome partitioning protein